VLSVIDKKGRVVGRLSPADEAAMLAAFATSGATAEARTRGADVVRTAQQRDCWFRCDCLGAADPAPPMAFHALSRAEPSPSPPVLIPVTETHIRRSPHHPEHAEGCPFEMTAAEREGYVASLREPAAGESFRLARAIGQPSGALVHEPGGASAYEGEEDEDGQAAGRGVHTAQRERGKLSQLLFKLLAEAKVHQVGRGPRGHADQQAALYTAAREISLGGDLRLSGVLYTDAGQLANLVGRVRLRARWPDGRRPHGVLVFTAERLESDVIVAVSGARLTVEGPIAVFGPGSGRVRTGPFVVAVLVASPDGRAAMAPLKAYAHPCWSAKDMLPVDSSHERRSLNRLVGFQSWMAEQGYVVEVTKPLHDRSRYFLGREEPDQLVKPDFEGKVFAAGDRFLRTFVVETMGLNSPIYRARKQRLKEILTRKPGRYLEHLAHDGIAQEDGDQQFRKDLFDFGQATIRADQRKSAAAPAPAAATRPLPLPPPVPGMPNGTPIAVVQPPPAHLPQPADAPANLRGPSTTWANAASTEPAAAGSLDPEPAGKLGWLAHQLWTMLGGRR